MKKIVLIAIMLNAQFAIACQYQSNVDELSGAIEDRKEMKKLATEFAKKADQIFIGTIKTFSATEAIFEDVVNLKGVTKESAKLQWIVPAEFTIGCGGLHDFSSLRAPEKGEMVGYLVYVKNGRILRVNHVGLFAAEPTGYEEVEWLESASEIADPEVVKNIKHIKK